MLFSFKLNQYDFTLMANFLLFSLLLFIYRKKGHNRENVCMYARAEVSFSFISFAC